MSPIYRTRNKFKVGIRISHGLVTSGANLRIHRHPAWGEIFKDDVVFTSASYALCQTPVSVLLRLGVSAGGKTTSSMFSPACSTLKLGLFIDAIDIVSLTQSRFDLKQAEI